MIPATPSPRPAREFGLSHALGISVGAHALLAALLFLLTMVVPKEAPVTLDEPLLKFTFNRDAEPTESAEPPRGTVPDPTPPAAQQQPAVVPSRQVAASQPAPQSPPPSPISQPPQQAQAPQRVENVGERQEDQVAKPTEVDPGREAPERADANSRPGSVDPRRRQAPQVQAPSLNVRGALQDYRRALDRAKSSRSQSSSKGNHKSVFVPDTSSMPIQGTPYGILEFTSRDYDWSDYYRQIYWDILKAWYRRLYSSTAEFEKWAHENDQWILNHGTEISFVIHRTGNVSDIVLHTPSGCVPLDESAMDGLSEVILVPLPDDFPRESEMVRAKFIAQGEIATMRQYFAYLRNVNFF